MSETRTRNASDGEVRPPGVPVWFAAKILGVWAIIEVGSVIPIVWLTPDIAEMPSAFSTVKGIVLLVWPLAMADPLDSRRRRLRWLGIAAAVATAGVLGEWTGALAIMALRPDLGQDVAGMFAVSLWTAALMLLALLPAAYPVWCAIRRSEVTAGAGNAGRDTPDISS